MAKILLTNTEQEGPDMSIMEEESPSGEILYTTLKCEYPGCAEVSHIAFSTLDADGKVKKDKKEKIKKDYYDTLPNENMPDKDNPGNWLCDNHKGA